MHVLLTGPFGTIGLRVLDALLQRGHAVTCFDLDNKINRKYARRFGKRITMVWGDITDVASVEGALANQEAVIHLAALIPPASESYPALAEKINVGGTQIIVDIIAAQEKKPLLVFPSSISVHGFSNDRQPPCRIDMPFEARDNYAGHKIECERRLRDSTIPWVILRIGACTDALNQKSGDVDAMLRHAFSLDSQTRIEYLHPNDAATAMTNALGNPAVIGKTLFLGSGKSSQTTWIEFLNIMPRAMGMAEIPADAFGKAHYYTDWMDTEESQRLLQFQQHGLNAYKEELAQQWRFLRYLIWPVRSVIRRHMLKFSQLQSWK